MNSTETKPDKGMVDAQESMGAGRDAAHDEHGAPPIVLDANRKLGRGPIVGLIVVALLLGAAILFGIYSRVHAEAALTTETQQDSVMAVSVTSASRGADALEITLPADTQAFIDTPIYARTSGYLRHWYADIGAHVRQGQVLAEIQTPELDQQVQQAQSDLLTAQANQNIAQITEERWKKLLAKNAVSKQEADQAFSDLSAKTSALASAQANVRRPAAIAEF